MIPLAPPPEPAEFDARVRRPGNAWLSRHPTAKPSQYKDCWNGMRLDVQRAFRCRCAYLGYNINGGHIDHFVPKSRNRTLVYEWSNYRWAEPRLNSLKSDWPFLDPFEIADGWISMDPVTLEYRATDQLPVSLAATAQAMLEIMNDRELCEARLAMLENFQRPDGSIDYLSLEPFFPLLARCLREAGFPQSGL